MVFFFYSPFINSFFNILTIFNFFHVYIIFFFVLLMFVGANPSVFPFSVLVIFLQYFLYFLIFSYFLFLFLLYMVL